MPVPRVNMFVVNSSVGIVRGGVWCTAHVDEQAAFETSDDVGYCGQLPLAPEHPLQEFGLQVEPLSCNDLMEPNYYSSRIKR